MKWLHRIAERLAQVLVMQSHTRPAVLALRWLLLFLVIMAGVVTCLLLLQWAIGLMLVVLDLISRLAIAVLTAVVLLSACRVLVQR